MRQGLIPRNQEQIAETLGMSIAENFFNPEDILDYIEKNHTVSILISHGKQIAIEKLNDRNSRRLITKWIIKKFRKNTSKIYTFLVDFSEKNLSKMLDDRIELSSLINIITDYIEKGIKNGTIDLHRISNTFTDFLQNKIPKISQILYDQIENYIDSQGTIKKGTIKFAKFIAQFDRDQIQDILFEKFSSRDFRQQIYRTVQDSAGHFSDYLKTESGSKQMNHTLRQFIVVANEFIKNEGIPLLMKKTETFLSKESSWKTLETYSNILLDFIKDELDAFVKTKLFTEKLKEAISWLLQKVNISSLVKEKIQAYNTSQLEKLIQNVTGEHLGAIEVLGGFLGAFTGVAIFNAKIFLLILAGMLGLGLIEYLLMRYHSFTNNNSNNKAISPE